MTCPCSNNILKVFGDHVQYFLDDAKRTWYGVGWNNICNRPSNLLVV